MKKKTFTIHSFTKTNHTIKWAPRSHQIDCPICELEKMDYTSIEMEAGDVLVHDLMLAHSCLLKCKTHVANYCFDPFGM